MLSTPRYREYKVRIEKAQRFFKFNQGGFRINLDQQQQQKEQDLQYLFIVKTTYRIKQMNTQQPRNIFQNFNQIQISNKIKEILSVKNQKGVQSPQEQAKTLFSSKQRVSTNTRPMTSHQQIIQQQQQKQQSQQMYLPLNNQNQPNQPHSHSQQRYSFQRNSIDSSPYLFGVKDQNLRLFTSYPGSPSMSSNFNKNTQFTWTPTESDYSETRQHFTYNSGMSNSSPFFNSKIMVSGNNQVVSGDKSNQSSEVYVVHNSQGNKYRSKLNSQVKTKLNKKNEIIKQFLIKNMKPSENSGFKKWIESMEQKSQIETQQNSEQKETHKKLPHAYLLKKNKHKRSNSPKQTANPIMLGGQNREYILSEQPAPAFKRPATSFLQRSKVLIPQTMASKDLIKQKQIIVSNGKQYQQSHQQQQQQSQNLHIYQQQSQKIDKANQSLDEESDHDTFELQMPQQENFKLEQNSQKKLIHSPERSQLQSFSIQESKFLEQGVDWSEEYYLNQKNQQQSSNYSSKHASIINKSSGQKQFKNQTEQTNFPDQEFNSLASFNDQSMEKGHFMQNHFEREDPEDGKRFQSSEKEKRKISSTNQIVTQKSMSQKIPQIAIATHTSQNSIKSQQIVSTKNLKSISNIQIDNDPRKKSIRGWSFVSEDETIGNQDTFRQQRFQSDNKH